MKLRFLKKDEKEKFIGILIKKYQLRESEFQLIEKESEIEAQIFTDKIVDGRYELNFMDNDLLLKISLYPPIYGKNLDLSDIIEGIKAEGVKEIMEERLIEAYELFQQFYIISNLTIAKGIKPINGKDAKLVIHFQEKVNDENKAEDDQGRVDYKEMAKIINVKKGELLITKYPATKGVPGLTVKGVEIPAKEGKDIDIVVLEGVRVEEDGRKYVAAIDGYVVFQNNKLAVYPVYTIKRVDYETGNVRFIGTVHVKGDVLADFKVYASKDIVVEGVVEDAELVADENIYVKTGIKGKLKHTISAKKNIVFNFAENMKLKAGEDIIINNFMMNCEAKAGGKIIAVSNKGLIAGGTVEAFKGIECIELGTKGVERFKVIVGINPIYKEKIEDIKRRLEKLHNDKEKIDGVLSQLDLNNKTILKNEKVKRMIILKKELEKNIFILKEQLRNYEEKMFDEKAKIRVTGIAYAGIDIQICNATTKVVEDIREGLYFLESKYNQVGWVSLEGLKESND